MIYVFELKKEARKNVKRNYFRNVVVAFICSILLYGGFNYATLNIRKDLVKDEYKILEKSKITNGEIIEELVDHIVRKNVSFDHKYGVISYIINETTSASSVVFSIINALNKIIFNQKLGAGVILLVTTFLYLLFNILFLQVFKVGEARYFLEHRRYKTNMDRILYPYKVKRVFSESYILFMRSIYQILWSLTIVMGFVKYYEYKMIPYILAENPNLSKKEVFRISREITMGKKMEMFKIDLSLLIWVFLKIISLNITSIFYSDVYKDCLYAEIYMQLRVNAPNDLCDNSLALPSSVDKFYVDKVNKKRLNLDYNKSYSLKTYILLFFTFSFIGWLFEVLLQFVKTGIFVNRGALYGPWLPIYGWGGILILILLKKFRDKPSTLFIMTFILCGIVEYFTSCYLEYVKHLKYWDYSGYFLNVNGRICLEGLMLFGFGGCAFTYILAPLFDKVYNKLNKKLVTIMCIILISLYVIDTCYSSHVPNTGEGISINISEV